MIVNYWAVFISAAVSMVIGSLWYGPLFGKMFMQAMGMDKMTDAQKAEMKKGMGMSYVLQFIGSLVMFYVLAVMMGRLNQLSVNGGLMVAFWSWLGFIVPIKLSDAIWGGKKVLFWLGIGHSLVNLLVAGAIIGIWI